MDGLGDWELLDFYGDTHNTLNSTSRSKNNFQFDDYFSSNSSKFSAPTQLLPVPIHFNPTIGDAPHDGDDPEVTKLPIDSTVAIAANNSNNQAFFVKMKETDQFVEMKMDSPKSSPIGPISPQIGDAGAYRFDSAEENGGENATSPRTSKADPDLDPAAKKEKEAADWGEESGGERVWKWSMTGIGALCSFGAAVATVCIINLGSHERNHHKHKARFQIYASEKRIKQVLHQATRLNEVMAGTAGVQLGRAHISYGGHYDSV